MPSESLAKRIIACLDVNAGRVVKGVQFVQLHDAGDPAELAAAHSEAGADEIVLLDITATAESRDTLLETVRRTANQLFIPFTVGGGIRSLDDAAAVLDCGADKVAINSAAVADPDLITRIARRYGSQAVLVAVDARRRGDAWEVYVWGGRRPTGKDAQAWAVQAEQMGAGEIMLTSMDRDGTKSGFDCALTTDHRHQRANSGDRFRRSGRAAAFRGGVPGGRRRCGAGGLRFPLWIGVGGRN